jgi:hypothetical protein
MQAQLDMSETFAVNSYFREDAKRAYLKDFKKLQVVNPVNYDGDPGSVAFKILVSRGLLKLGA